MEELLLEQQEIISRLTELCDKTIAELAQYKGIEAEERMLQKIIEEE